MLENTQFAVLNILMVGKVLSLETRLALCNKKHLMNESDIKHREVAQRSHMYNKI